MKRSVSSGIVGLLLCVLAGWGCSCGKVKDPECGERLCTGGTPNDVPRGITSDGRVDVTAAEAWPTRKLATGAGPLEPGQEPLPLKPEELALACALINGCKTTESDGTPLTDDAIAKLTQDCAAGRSSANAKEERGIPQAGQNERFDFEARAVLALAAPRKCADIRAVATPRESVILCQEDGCWWESTVPPPCCQSVPSVSCNGDVATLTTDGLTFVRDCTRAFARCDPHSTTGCTDRAPVSCADPTNSHDRCAADAPNVKLGCDHEGKVSFHDCARYPGGTCVEDPKGATCDLHEDSTCPTGCDASAPNKLKTCVAGKSVSVDCGGLAMGTCEKGHCTGG